MLRRIVLIIVVLAVVAGGAFFAVTVPRTLDASDLPERVPDLDNGRTMFWAGGCASCHAAPGAKDEARLRLGGGVELDTPFGVFRAPNISPHPEDGIGAWSTLDFANAMVRGVAPDARHYYPAFPYPNYQRMPLEDVIDLKAFLDTLPAVTGRASDHALGFPFNIRRGLGLWKLRYLDGATFTPDPSAPAPVERGRYLVEGPGHCGACHTPRDAFGGELAGRHLAGAKLLENSGEDDASSPNITPHADGLGGWSENDIAYSLKSGFTPEFDSFGGAMVSVQSNWANVTDDDRAAVAAYLKSIPALPSAAK